MPRHDGNVSGKTSALQSFQRLLGVNQQTLSALGQIAGTVLPGCKQDFADLSARPACVGVAGRTRLSPNAAAPPLSASGRHWGRGARPDPSRPRSNSRRAVVAPRRSAMQRIAVIEDHADVLLEGNGIWYEPRFRSTSLWLVSQPLLLLESFAGYARQRRQASRT